MSIASKLKDLVIKWGGQPTKDDDSIEELIALLTELDAPSGSGGVYFLTPVDVSYIDKTGTFEFSISESYNDIENKLINGIEVAIILRGSNKLTNVEEILFLKVMRAMKSSDVNGSNYAVYFNDPANTMLYSTDPDDPMSNHGLQ